MTPDQLAREREALEEKARDDKAQKITWTKAELAGFEAVTDMLSSPRQIARINARFAVLRQIEQHGREKCQAMHEFLVARDAAKAAKKGRK